MGIADEHDHEDHLTALIMGTRDLLLRLKLQLEAGPPGPEAVAIAGLLHDMRGPLAAVEYRRETYAAAYRSGTDDAWRHAFARGYRAGQEACPRCRAREAPLPAVRNIRAIGA